MILLDASVAFKWFVPEHGTEEAQRLLLESDQVIAPSLVLAEVGNALWKAWHRDAFVADDYKTALANLRAAFTRLLPLEHLIGRAGEIAVALQHPIYDCFYLASAELLERPLITADLRLLNKTASGPWESHRQPLLWDA